MTAPHKIFPHGKPEDFAPGLWQVRGTLSFPLTRKMVIHRLQDGTLLLHSVIAMDEDGMRALEALGRPAVMVVPHPMHLMDAPFYAARYPEMKVVAPKDIADKLAQRGVKVDGSPEEELPRLDIQPHVAQGLKVTEVVLDVPSGEGRALLFTDLVGRGKAKGLFMRVLGAPGGSGVARIVKLRQIGDKAKVREFLRRIAETPKLSTVMGAHSDPISDGAADFLRAAADGV